MFDFFKRDFMLGVGAGLIISGILVSLSGNGQLSDEEVRARAAKLGMVQKREASQDQSAAKPQQPETQKTEPTKTEQTKPTKPQPTKTEASNPEPSKPEQPDTSPATKPVNNDEFVTIEIKPGMGSESVIRILEKKGVISDSEEFYKVMTKYNAHSRLKVGTFKIPEGTGMKEIVDILTGKSKDN